MAIKDIHNFGCSVKDKLLNISRNEKLGYQMLVTRYLQERLLYRLSISPYHDHFFLKGGALLYAHERFMARPTLDIDFMGHRIDNDKENVRKVFAEICAIPYLQDGVVFHTDTLRTDDIAVEKKYPGVRLTLTATLDTIRQDVSMDIGFGDIITPCPSELDYPNLIDGFPETKILAYSLETVIAEKFQTVIVRAEANSRMKDYFDLYTILKGENYDEETLSEAIIATFKNRQTGYMENHIMFSPDFSLNKDLNTRWNSFVKKLKLQEPLAFPEVVGFLQTKLKPYWERLK
ncbi:MAG: nucleotidyl transferase AbiEii/AbiGii toxin family protein [Candidatus Cryptobacteroides sp.]